MSHPEPSFDSPALSDAKRRLLDKWLGGRLQHGPKVLPPAHRPSVRLAVEGQDRGVTTAWNKALRTVNYSPEHFGALSHFVDRIRLNLALAHAGFVDYYYAGQDWCRLYLAVGPDESIVACYGLESARFEYNNILMTIGFSSNFYSLQPGAGLYLFGCASDWCPIRLIFGGTMDTHKMFRDLNWKRYQGMKTYVLNRSYETYPGDGWVRVAGKSLAQRLARRKLSHFAGRLSPEACEQVSVREEQTFTEDLLPVSSPFTLRLAASQAYLNWRYNTALSFVHYRLFRILSNGQTAGYVVINEMPDKLIVAQCDGTDAHILAYGVLRTIIEVGREDRTPRSVILASCHPAMQAIYARFGFRPEAEDRPFYIGTVDGNVEIDGDTANWLVNYDWGDNGLRPPFPDQRPNAAPHLRR
jgi:hypothetical protein